MTEREYFSERSGGTRTRELEDVSVEAWRGLVALIWARINQQWLASEYPVNCADGVGVVDTATRLVEDSLAAHVPGLDWPLSSDHVPARDEVFDLVEFLAHRVAKPTQVRYHDFYRHHELTFDVPAGRREFSRDVNEVLRRAGLAHELDGNLRVIRLGRPEARQLLADLRPDSGDVELDRLIVDARRRYLSRGVGEQLVALEMIWDAFERMKTIENGVDKKAKAKALLDSAASGPRMRQALEDEAKALTAIGNEMRIRHSETDKEAIADVDVDYLFTRMAAFVLHVLRKTGRLKT